MPEGEGHTALSGETAETLILQRKDGLACAIPCAGTSFSAREKEEGLPHRNGAP